MNATVNQAKLSAEQIEAFHHDNFVDDQVRDFREMVGKRGDQLVVDIGGGSGHISIALARVSTIS